MKKLLIAFFLIFFSFLSAQNKYPFISNDNKDQNTLSYLYISEEKYIDLNDYANVECEFNMLAFSKNKIIIEFNEPSNLSRKGRCASGSEIGFIQFEFDSDLNITNSNKYLIESCLWSIEYSLKENSSLNTTEYLCENYQSSEIYSVVIDKEKVDIKILSSDK